MRILVVGATGTLGQAIIRELAPRHEIVRASRKGADVAVDITDMESVRRLYATVGALDAVACAAGNVHFGPLTQMQPEHLQLGLADKLMGQVNLVLAGIERVNAGGSFTLISGILSHDPIRAGASASMVNGAIDSFVLAAAIELPRDLRINSVSPTLFVESVPAYGPFFPGFKPVPVAEAARAYAKSIEGAQTGRTYVVE